MFTVLLAEDDETLCGTLTKHLEAWGYRVVAVRDFSRVTQEFAAAAPHIVLLDILLPYYDGYHWCQEIRKISDVPIVFLSSASDNMNLVMAIHMGGDDFVAKPFDASVLMAKMRAVLRRTYESSRRLAVIEHRGAVLNLNDFTLSYGGQTAELTKNEFRILETLLCNRGKIVSRDTLMMKLWQDDNYVEENTLTVNVNRLRKKLEELGMHGWIATKVGCGYRIE